MGLQSKYDQLIDEQQSHQAGIAHQSRAVYHEYQREIDARGVKVITFEVEHGIDKARHLIEHEKGFAGQLEQFEGMVTRYSEPVDWSAEVAARNIAPDDLETRIAERSHILSEAKRSVATLKRMTADADQRRGKIGREALEIARLQDPLNRNDRETFTQIFTNTRAARATQELVAA